MAREAAGTELQGQTNKGLYGLSDPSNGGIGLRLGSGEGLRYGDVRASNIQDDFGLSPVEGLGASGTDAIGQAYEYMQAYPQSSMPFREVADYYDSKAAYGSLPSLTPDATRVGFNSMAGEVWSTAANTFPVTEQNRLQPTALAPLVTGWAGLRSSQSPVDMIPTGGYSLVPSTQPERVGVLGQGLDLLERFENSPAGMMVQGLPPEGFILGVAKGALNGLSKLERIGNAGIGVVDNVGPALGQRGLSQLASPRTPGLAPTSTTTELLHSGAIPGREGVVLTQRHVGFNDLQQLSENRVSSSCLRGKMGSSPTSAPIPGGVRPVVHTHPLDEHGLNSMLPSRADINVLNDYWARIPTIQRPVSQVITGPNQTTIFRATGIDPWSKP